MGMNRGKRKGIADFSVTLEWTLTDMTNESTIEGSMVVEDISADREYTIGEMLLKKVDGETITSVSALNKKSSHLKEIYEKTVKKASKSEGSSSASSDIIC